MRESVSPPEGVRKVRECASPLEGVRKMRESVSPSEGANGENVSVIAFFVYVVEN